MILKLPASVAAESLCVAAAIGVVSSFIPALGVLRREISDTMRAVA